MTDTRANEFSTLLVILYAGRRGGERDTFGKIVVSKTMLFPLFFGKKALDEIKGKKETADRVEVDWGGRNEKLKSKNLVAEFQSCEKSVVGSFRLSTSIPDESNYIRSPLAFGERGNAVANL